MSESIAQYYRCPEQYLRFAVDGELSAESGYFLCGDDAICYGKTSNGQRSCSPAGAIFDVLQQSAARNGTVHLPFGVDQVLQALRCEIYASEKSNFGSVRDSAAASLYYLVRPVLPVGVRKHLQRVWLKGWGRIPFPSWPVDFSADNLARRLLLLTLRANGLERVPFIWFWPDGASSCAIMTHDVEATEGRDSCSALMDVDDSFGIKSSFQIVPEERYEVPQEYLSSIRDRGFEVNVQDLNHDGRLYKRRSLFIERARKINSYGEAWGARGFRAAVLYRKQLWFDQLKFEYDMSVPNVAHLDPQRGGCCTVMPYFIGDILELPVTTTQDYSLFHILKSYSLDLWKRQTELIMERHGLVSFIIHPDYIVSARARRTYEELLGYLASLRGEKGVWLPTPGEVNKWWRQRAKMMLVEEDGEWRIEGEGHERASVAYAIEHNGMLEVDVESATGARVRQKL
jgi:hypothetical protein